VSLGRGDERGSVSVVAAAVLVILLICTIGVTDLSRALRVRAQTRTAADAAALAAAQELAMPTGQDPALIAASIAWRNGAMLRSCICAVGSYDAVVTVERDVSGLWLVPGMFALIVQARAVVDLP
jgi:secretion/DNA translocation related TadE-like protein